MNKLTDTQYIDKENIDYERKEKELRTHYNTVFNTVSGKKVIEDLIGFNKSTLIDRNNPNPNAALYSIAQMTIVNRIINKMKRN